MRLDPTVQETEIDSWLRSVAEITYGAARAEELADQIHSMADAMAVLATISLDFADSAPDHSGGGDDQP